MRLSHVIIFRNGNIAAFDENGNQIPELQKMNIGQILLDRAECLGCGSDSVSVDFIQGSKPITFTKRTSEDDN